MAVEMMGREGLIRVDGFSTVAKAGFCTTFQINSITFLFQRPMHCESGKSAEYTKVHSKVVDAGTPDLLVSTC
jgi:hypothetical protein